MSDVPNAAGRSPAPPAGPVLAVCGWSGSGKTTLLERVIPILGERGLSVCALKHDAHGIRYDLRGKDSDRLFQAGADVALRGPGEALVRKRRTPADGAGAGELFAQVAGLLEEYDVVLVEGHKDTPLPKVWLSSAEDAEAPPGVTGILRTLPREPSRAEDFLQVFDGWIPAAWNHAPLRAGILIGGAARRMGKPKQLLRLDGKTFLDRTLETLSRHTAEVVLLGDGPVPDSCSGLPRLPDPPDLAGPLAGILGAMRWAPRASWIVAGCDQPLISDGAVRWLLAERRPGRWAVLPRIGEGRVEPLPALYDSRARGLLEAMAASGRLAPSALARSERAVSPSPPAPLAAAWRNVNTPEELEALLRDSVSG